MSKVLSKLMNRLTFHKSWGQGPSEGGSVTGSVIEERLHLQVLQELQGQPSRQVGSGRWESSGNQETGQVEVYKYRVPSQVSFFY